MDILIASVIWVTVGSSVSAFAIDRAELIPNREALIMEARCPSNCQGDFPVPNDRKYADGHKASGRSKS
jgi:hypothetical protein